MELAPATRDDLAFLVELRNEAVNARWSKRGTLSPAAIEADYFGAGGKHVYVASQGGVPLGYAIYRGLGGGEFEISVAIVPARRGQGLGVRLIELATAHAFAEHAADRVIAEVYAGNAGSVRAFERAGYRLTADQPVGEGERALRRYAARPD